MHYNMKKLEYNYPDCLSNCKDLNLGKIYARFRHIPNLPELTTIYEIERPLIIALDSLESIVTELDKELSNNTLKGLFVLGVSHFEVLLSDLLKRIVLLHPDSLNVLNGKKENKDKTENAKYEVSVENLVSGDVTANIIENKINKLCFDNVETIIKKLKEVLKHDSEIDIDKIVEIKETRNLLLHNNLIVNDYYLNKTKSIKRADKKGQQLPLDCAYVKESVEFILETVRNIRNSVTTRYSNYSLIELIKRLWAFTFSSSGIPTLIEDFWVLNYEKDIIDGPVKPPKEYFGSSEKFFYEIWKSQRTGCDVSRFAMVHLDSRNINKLSFLIEVFGELRFPYW